jgi:hypothetical protein
MILTLGAPLINSLHGEITAKNLVPNCRINFRRCPYFADKKMSENFTGET